MKQIKENLFEMIVIKCFVHFNKTFLNFLTQFDYKLEFC